MEGENLRKISYDPLWKKLIDLKLSKTELMKKVGISKATVSKMGKEEYVSLEVVVRICNTLGCEISDVIELHKARSAE